MQAWIYNFFTVPMMFVLVQPRPVPDGVSGMLSLRGRYLDPPRLLLLNRSTVESFQEEVINHCGCWHPYLAFYLLFITY
jgi:hypothetical protein